MFGLVNTALSDELGTGQVYAQYDNTVLGTVFTASVSNTLAVVEYPAALLVCGIEMFSWHQSHL